MLLSNRKFKNQENSKNKFFITNKNQINSRTRKFQKATGTCNSIQTNQNLGKKKKPISLNHMKAQKNLRVASSAPTSMPAAAWKTPSSCCST